MNKLFIDKLPKYRGGIDWKQCEGLNVNFHCNSIDGSVQIVRYYTNKKYIRYIYNGHTFFKNIDSFRNGDLTDSIQLKEDGYYYNIGDIIETLSGQIQIIDKSRFNHSKAYIYNCLIDGFEWVITESHLLDKHGCTICGGKTVERGINDTWTTNPDLAAMLVDNEVGYYYTQNSSHKTDWKCPDCGFVIKNKSFKDINQDGLRCPRCRDGFPFGEKFVVSLLDQLQVNFYHRYWFDWAGREYDIYIPDLKCIIEIHGRQHYETVHFHGKQNKSLEYVRQNDMYKYQMAINNGIEKYIVIDARNSTDVWIKRSILDSELSNLYDLSNINWAECKTYAVTSMIKEACRLWNDNLTYTIKDIREIMQKGDSTIRNWLKIGAELGWCDYTPDKRRFFGNCNYCNQKNKIMNLSYIEKGTEYIKIDENNVFVREARYCPYCKKDTYKH